MADVSASQTNKETARPVGCAAVGEERALRMRRAPCGYAPYGYERTFAVGADDPVRPRKHSLLRP